MRISTRTVWQMNPDGSFTELERESYDYDGPLAQAFGGRSRQTTQTTSTQDIDTTSVGLQDVQAGVAVAAGGDVFLETTDLGAVQGAFTFGERSLDFAGEFGAEAFDFGSDIARQAGQTAREAVEVSRQAIATVATGGATDLQAGSTRQLLTVGALAALAVLGFTFIRARA